VAAEAGRLAEFPEVHDLAVLLEAWCLVRSGQPARALAQARQAVSGLERDGRWRFEAHVWLGLAHRVAGEAAAAAGDPVQARSHLDQAHELAPTTWFGRRGR
jgi:hypothetical protein